MSILRKVLDHPVVEGLADIGEFTMGFLEFFGECIVDTFNNDNSSSYVNGTYTDKEYIDNNYQDTYNYWISLDYDEQYEYYHNNEYLQRNMPESQFYEKDRELSAKHVAEWADKLGRPFTDKYDRY